MKHVDEGLLHAYLDEAFRPGEALHTRIRAHLALCEECRARLEEARQLRDLAAVIVDDLGPRERIIAPAGPRSAAVEAQRKVFPASAMLHPQRWLPLAWAASILLALAGGWFVGESWQSAERIVETGDGRRPEAGSALGDVLHLPDGEVAGIPEPPTDRPSPSPPAVAAAPPASRLPEAPQMQQAEPLLLPEVTPRLAADQERPLPQQTAGPAAPPTTHSPGELAAAPLPRAAEIVAPPPPAEGRRGREPVAAERTVAGPLPETPATGPRAGAARGGPRPSPRAGPGGARPSLPILAPRPSSSRPEVSWRPVFQSEAEERLREPLAFVEGLPISGVWVAPDGRGWKARVTQPLEGGGVLELIQWGAGASGEGGPAAPVAGAEEAAGGQATVLIRLRPGGPKLSLTGPLSQEALRELARRVRAGQP